MTDTPLMLSDDTLAASDLLHSKPRKERQDHSSLRLVRVGSILVLLLLSGQALRLQGQSGTLFRRAAEGNRVREMLEYAPRGIFLDRHGEALVQNIQATQLVADAPALPQDIEKLFQTLREAFPQRDLMAIRERLQTIVRTDPRPVPLFEDLTQEEYLAFLARADHLPGIRADTRAVRSYRPTGAYAHVLGYTGAMSLEERPLFQTYELTDPIGKVGLERQYEALLHGRHGVLREEVNAQGDVRHDLGRVPPVPGLNLRLHLDARLQEAAQQALDRGLRSAGVRAGVVVGLDPSNGAVRVLVSAPTYDHTAFARGSAGPSVRETLKHPGSPLLNRALQGTYSPGSTFKLAVAAAALEEGLLTPTTRIQSTGGLRVGPWFFPDWKPAGHGTVDLVQALAESVNTYFYIAGGGFEEVSGLGIERMTAWARRLGVGLPTGIDLPEEGSGFLPSREWKEREKQESWYIGDTYHAAIGQGDVLLTPLQLAVLTSVIANGETLYEPRLLDAVEGPDGEIREQRPPVVRAKNVLHASTAAAIRRGMRAAVTDGSARGLAGLPVAVAAKTGTAQIGGTEKTHAWVTTFAPSENPELVLVVLLEKAGGGDRFAVPVAREILQTAFSAP